MTLNKQLLCVSLLLLSLPWAGCQYLQEMDSALKSGQQETLQASATAIATALAQDPSRLEPHGETVRDAQTSEPAIYCYPLNAPIRVDGYFDEWADESSEVPWSDYRSADGHDHPSHHLRYRCGVFNGELALNFAVVDPDVIYNNPTQSLAANGDRVILATGSRDYVLTAVAPGTITARYFADNDTTYRESRIKAAWIDNDNGYQIELKMPISLADKRLSFAVIDVSKRGQAQYGPYIANPAESAGNPLEPRHAQQVPRFVYQATAIEQALATFSQPGIRLRLCNPQGLLLASVGSPQPQQTPTAHWLLRKLYRAILDRDQSQYQSYSNGVDFSEHREFAAAVKGDAGSLWYRDPHHSNYQLLSSAVPIVDQEGHIDAVLLAEQSSEQTAALTDRAFSRLFLLSLAVLAFTALALLSYASWLSWRIRNLSRATQQALEDPRQLTRVLPNSQARDEIGSLTRNYSELMQRIAEYTDYLQTLARKLSHELRTPLAIIHSSLDNLASRELDDASRTYQQRAKDGALRLGNILTAMSEARRVEESIEHADPEPVEIGELLGEVCRAYRDLYRQHRIELTVELKGGDSDGSTVWITAVPDLLVQMLDKLMENAASFCPEQKAIALALAVNKSDIRISVSNDGPLLPDTMQSQLFDNMVSMRGDNEKDIHLGLGLHIVSLIVDYHGGRVSAENRADRSGVVFHIHLPRGGDA